MAYEIIMPKLGVDMKEGQITKWLKKEGDLVKEGEIIFEILSDKTNMEIESDNSGYLLKILYKEDDIVPVTTVIGYIGDKDEKLDLGTESKNEDKPAVDEKTNAPQGVDKYDVFVVGAGPAGYYAAIKAAQLGAKVGISEKDELGGTCLNRGCIPTKTFLKTTEIIESIKLANKRGVIMDSYNYKVDLKKLVAEKNKVVKTLTGGIKVLLNSNNVDIFNELAVVNSDKTIKLGSKTVYADKIILATGSKVIRINIPGVQSKLVLTSDDLLDVENLPRSLVVIGGGVVGCEMAQAFSSFGCSVTIIEMSETIVPAMDVEVSNLLKKQLETKGITILTNTKLNSMEEVKGQLRFNLEGKDSITADNALLSIGRAPELNGLENLDLKLERGKVVVNEYLETNIKGVYAAGDVNGLKMLAHAAFKMGETAASNAVLGNVEKVSLHSTPAAIYTLPEVGIVGLTESEARKSYDVSVGKFNFNSNGRAVAAAEAEGFVKVIIDKKYGEILGVHIIGPSAAEIINEAATLVELEVTVDDIEKTIHGHPTYSEAMYEAFMDAVGKAIHIPRKNNKKY